MIGWNLSEGGHIVPLIFPVDGNAGAPVTSLAFHMKGHAHATIIIMYGVTAAAPTSIIAVCSTAASGGTTTQLPFRYYRMETTNSDVMTGPTLAVAASGIASLVATDKICYTIEIDSAELTDGQPYIQLQITEPASSNLVAALAVLSGARQAYQNSASVIA